MIDTFSRMAYTRGLKTKSAVNCAAAIDDILGSMEFPPALFYSDSGLEFHNDKVKEIVRDKYGMEMFKLKGPIKAAIVERCVSP